MSDEVLFSVDDVVWLACSWGRHIGPHKVRITDRISKNGRWRYAVVAVTKRGPTVTTQVASKDLFKDKESAVQRILKQIPQNIKLAQNWIDQMQGYLARTIHSADINNPEEE